MSASEMDKTALKPSFAPSPLTTFFIKLAAVTCAVLVFFYMAFTLITGFIEERANELAILKGGPAFWGTMEEKLYKLASGPDLPPEKKEKIVSALRTLSVRYKPYVDAIAGDVKSQQQR
jgi:hypothetical protein